MRAYRTPPECLNAFLAKPALAPLARRCVAAVSGGADSVALLLAALEAGPALGWEVRALHCDHGLRGRASDADRRFVEELCERLGVPLRVFRERLSKGPGLELRARQWRRRCYGEVCAEAGAELVLLGQHQGDQAETILMNLARGAGWRGAAGMRALSRLERESSVMLGRPFLGARPEALRTWLKARGQSWREDASNQGLAFGRNRVRHRVLPELARVQPAARENLARFGERAAQAEKALRQLALVQARECQGGRALELRVAPLASLPPSARREVLRAWAQASGCGMGEAALARLLRLSSAPAGKAVLGGGWGVSLSAGQLRLTRTAEGGRTAAVETPLSPGSAVTFNGWTIQLERERAPLRMAFKPGLPEKAFAFSTRAGAAWLVRPPKPAERMRPFGLAGTKLVADCLAEAGVPTWERQGYPVVAKADGEVLALPGVRRGAAFPLGEKAKEGLILRWKRGL